MIKHFTNLGRLGAAALMVLLWSGCEKPPEPVVESTPVPTPHPALGASEQAKKLYPDLTVKGSLFNTTFLEIYTERLKNNPASLAKVDWPLDVARQAGGILGVRPAQATPVPVATPPPPPPPKEVGTLDRGPYNEKRGVSGRSMIVDPSHPNVNSR